MCAMDNSLQHELYQPSLKDTFVWKKHENLGYPTHFHAAMEIYFILDGEMEANINGKTHHIVAGDIAIVNPFELHTYTKITQAHVAVLIIGETFLSDFQTEYEGFILPSHLTDKEFNQKILAILNEVPASFNNNETLSILEKKAYVNFIFAKIISRYKLSFAHNLNNEITTIIRYIYDHYTEPLTLDTLSQALNYSRSSISRLLSKYIQTDLRCFVNNLRVEQAELFLSNPEYAKVHIIDIALNCGFDSIVTFYRAYKRRFGHNPRKN